MARTKNGANDLPELSNEKKKMMDYLPIFRKLMGYSQSKLAEEIGVARSTIINFEKRSLDNSKIIEMSTPQYIALRVFIETRAAEMKEKNNDETLLKAYKLVFYNKNYERDKKIINEKLATAAAAAAAKTIGVIGATPPLAFISAIPAAGLIAGITIGAVSFLKKKAK